MRTRSIVVAGLAFSLAAYAEKDLFQQQIPEGERIEHALNRLTFGPKPGDVERVERIGLKKWIDQQLHADRIPENPMLSERLKTFDSLAITTEPPAGVPRGAAAAAVARGLTESKLLRAIYSNRQLEEVLTDFWFNHFNVYLDKGADRFLVTGYERDAIRPHVLGKFKDLLTATAKSPAMLFYLDNWQSVGPEAPQLGRGIPKAAKKGTRG